MKKILHDYAIYNIFKRYIVFPNMELFSVGDIKKV